MKARYYEVKHGTLNTMQEVVSEYGLTITKMEGRRRGFKMHREDGAWRTVIDFRDGSVPLGIYDRTYDEWDTILRTNAKQLLDDQ